MANLVGKFLQFCGRISSVLLPRSNASKRSVLLVASVGGLFTLFVTAIYMRRRRKAVRPKSVSNEKVTTEESQISKRKRRLRRNLDFSDHSSSILEEKKYVTRHRRDHSALSETSTLSSARSSTSRRSRKTSFAIPGTKQYFEAEKLYQKGVNAFESALEQWEMAGFVLESSDGSIPSLSDGVRSSMRKSNHSESSVQTSPRSKTMCDERFRSESEGATDLSTNPIPSSGAGDHGDIVTAKDQVRAPVHEIEDKLVLFMERAEKLRRTFEEALYSDGSDDDSDTDITVTGYDADSDTASFVSAKEVWETLSLDDNLNQRLALYEDALVAVDSGQVRCRTTRTEMLECFSDTEFLAKLHCVRQAVDLMLQDHTVRDWLIEHGRAMIECLLRSANRNSSHFIHSFNSLIKYGTNPENFVTIEEELKYRKVVSMTFYDVVLDFIIMDSFDDLANPPRQLVAVLGNRWLTNSIKETALNTAVWSLLKAKTRMLRYQDGFIAKFYAVSETISPVLAWGFLGTDDKLKCDCEKFKFEVLSFLRGIFSFDQVRYSTIEQMSDDILKLAKEKIQQVLDHFEVTSI